jgi:hypothetical protein
MLMTRHDGGVAASASRTRRARPPRAEDGTEGKPAKVSNAADVSQLIADLLQRP